MSTPIGTARLGRGGGLASMPWRGRIVWPLGFPGEEFSPPHHLRWYGFPHCLRRKCPSATKRIYE
eukprot:11086254-Prorocentrum_lima.AAC.1